MQQNADTIVAISTPPGQGALGMIRLSGPEAITIVDGVFKGKLLANAAARTVHYGRFMKGEETLDEVVVILFRGPKSFTREDTVELSFHGSPYILREALQVLVNAGARLAEAGEFTQRAFLNGGLDLAQAEAVADLIASNSAGAHKLALNQLRGGVSNELKDLREQLLNFTSLIELELDFGEEDVEFADRSELTKLVQSILQRTTQLIDSFALGNALKQGVPTVILGKPNAGKSTLLNALLNENRAIVSDIPGTTRDMIEDRLHIQGIEFRLQDTAGVRETTDQIEAEGVSRSLALAAQAGLVLYVFDATTESVADAEAYVESLELGEGHVLLVGNKQDLVVSDMGSGLLQRPENGEAESRSTNNEQEIIKGKVKSRVLSLSAKHGDGLNTLRAAMVAAVESFSVNAAEQVIISNVRHVNALQQAQTHLHEVLGAIDMGIPSDLMTIDIRAAIHHIGEITGEITNDEVLGNIFSKFCIGK
jgi:tRNA modification GTPase